VAKYQRPDPWRSAWQILNTFLPYGLLWWLMVRSMEVSCWLTLALAIPAAGFLVRIFIIFHDCGHGAFFRSQRANNILGVLSGILVLTPYHQWRHDHAMHHATAGDLDRRGVGDVWTLTVREYLDRSRWKRFCYRLCRHPLVMFVVVPALLFLGMHRFVHRTAGRRERLGVYGTNLAIAALVAAMTLTIGFRAYALVQLSVGMIAGAAGVWLFYVQHQFAEVCWDRGERWDYERVALEGSSFYKLPAVLQWFTGNIGFHHIHHLRPRIPNYYLQRCHEEAPSFHAVKPLTVRASLKSVRLHLWDEERRELIGYRDLRTLPRR
jgi:omega-6 fatty acid desaturase (delta-12 desaturase)